MGCIFRRKTIDKCIFQKMKEISDKHLRDMIDICKAYSADIRTTENTREYNKKRKARLLAR